MGWNFFDTTGNTKKVTLTGSVDLPIGTVLPFASNTVPTGWRLCDGTAVSRTLTADLFTVIGTSYGVGDGSTTFNLPDLRGRVPVGKTTGGTFPTLGGTGGAETHTLTGAESGTSVHGHGGTLASGNASTTHSHGAGSYITNNVPNAYTAPIQNGLSGTSFFGVTNVVNTGVTGTSDVNSNSHTHNVTIPNSGAANASQGHNNLQPYQVVNYIIKAEHVGAAPGVGLEMPQPHARVTHNAAQSIPNASNTVIAFNTQRWATVGMHNTVTNNSRLVATDSGLYTISGQIQWAANATGFRGILMRVNGVDFIATDERLSIGANNMEVSVTTQWRLDAGDYVELLAVQTSGAPLNINSSAMYSPDFMMVRNTA